MAESTSNNFDRVWIDKCFKNFQVNLSIIKMVGEKNLSIKSKKNWNIIKICQNT